MVVLVVTLVALGPAAAQERRESHCIALVDGASGMAVIERAAYTDPLPEFTVRISYLAHAMFLLQTPGGLSAVTDYTGFLGTADFVPDVATMNRAHATHWTAYPDPRIPHVLPGWASDGGRAEHHLDLGEMLVRNVTTDIRSWGTDLGRDGNSVFIFEVAGLCIGHLGHLHHEPTPAQYAAIGRLDVVMAAVDGGLTLDTETMIRVLGRLKARVVIPMHWFGRDTLERFLAGMRGEFDVVDTGLREITLSLHRMPARPTVMVLEPGPLD